MDAYSLFLILLGLYVLMMIGIGWYFTKKQKSVTDFWLAGRKVSYLVIGCSAAASWITAGGILAVVGLYMVFGMGSIWEFAAPNVIALILIALLVTKIKHLPAITQPELLEQRYSSAIRGPVALIISVVMILFAVADIKGFAFVLEIFYGIPQLYAAAIVALAVSLYVTLGGFYAVVWTDMIQFTFLAVFSFAMAFLITGAAASGDVLTPAMTTSELFSTVPSGWWDPLSVGPLVILIFIFAIIPGWITEQDPWQKVWASKDEKTAKYGMLLGSFFIFLIFGVCCIAIAIGLNHIYPEIAAAGPAGMADAEPALLNFIFQNCSPLIIGLSSVGLAAAAMSSTDTFATSGGSCLSRDIYQRYIKPDATMKEVLIANRISIIIIILGATIGSFYINGIIDAIHIATFIASSSYFFPLMGGLYWKRATKEGALAGLIVGFIAQVVFTIADLNGFVDLANIHPLLSNHGVIAGMVLSGIAFFGVSLATKPSDTVNLAPFFKEAAKELEEKIVVDEADPEYKKMLKAMTEEITGDRAHLHLILEASATVNWNKFVKDATGKYHEWVTPTGVDSVYRLTKSDMLACITVTRGESEKEIWFSCEPRVENIDQSRKEMFVSFGEVSKTLKGMGVLLTLP
ncbi:sodium:solute symporter family protein [uncultured Methanomethylovorans sp.]|uniref:sodium:solute symporter family protein n=1 Tax=uncultured Methanomethylovorans sp. TaxID=183759 RepID=UPI002AA93389|nr:sodium:solute symporter family protein [uncultured Methanomethylovorans sp.]